MIGWIALYRSIMEHWIWNTSSRRFQRWVDLLFLASWKDREVGFGSSIVKLKRGQIVTSLRTLMRRWKTNNTTVANTLKLFADNGMIKCYRGKSYMLITVTNYDKYQRLSILAKSLSDEQQFAELTPQPNGNYFPENVTEETPDSEHLRVQKRVPIEQDNNIINNKQQIVVVDDAHAKEFLVEVLSQAKTEQACMTYKITPEQYKTLAEEIVNGWLFSNEQDWSLKHFANTMRIKSKELKRDKAQDGKVTTGTKGHNHAGGGEPNPLSRARVHRADDES